MKLQLELSKKVVVELTRGYLTMKVTGLRGVKPSLTTPELLGHPWCEELQPFYLLYNNHHTAGQQMGKLLHKVCVDDLGMSEAKEDRRGKKAAITRYFFNI